MTTENKAAIGTGAVVKSEEGLKKALAAVRLVQNYAAVGAEILILVAFAMSSLDVSVGGNLASISGLAWVWGAVFALGIDTCFVLSWVRVRQMAVAVGKRRHLVWAIPLALGMSFIVFQPVAIQQLQQSLHISFEQALANLGVNLGFLVYARSGVAVFLGAVLALTNVETATTTTVSTISANPTTAKKPNRQVGAAKTANPPPLPPVNRQPGTVLPRSKTTVTPIPPIAPPNPPLPAPIPPLQLPVGGSGSGSGSGGENRRQKVVELGGVVGLSVREIVDRTGIPETTVRRYLSTTSKQTRSSHE